jgi:hypothetical protein
MILMGWAEIKEKMFLNRIVGVGMSRPARARGLKPEALLVLVITLKSRPARARGLKPSSSQKSIMVSSVAPCAGAWIETI